MAIQRDTISQVSAFAAELDEGLSQEFKHISSKWFYDDEGSRIFQEIMHMPEYYLTDAEFEILSTRGADILAQLPYEGHFNLLELGAGDGLKTKELIKFFLSENLDFTYKPVDISAEAISQVVKSFEAELPSLSMEPLIGDYFEELESLQAVEGPNLILFLGSNIGNYTQRGAIELLRNIRSTMKPDDRLMVGYDLKKNPQLIKKAYDDPHGITRAFNLNLLNRANKELGADFMIDQFDFYCHYNPLNGEVRSYLVSLKDQDVFVSELNKSFHFDRYELVWTELSKKYATSHIKALGEEAGLEVIEHFKDCKEWFSDTLYRRSNG